MGKAVSHTVERGGSGVAIMPRGASSSPWISTQGSSTLRAESSLETGPRPWAGSRGIPGRERAAGPTSSEMDACVHVPLDPAPPHHLIEEQGGRCVASGCRGDRRRRSKSLC